MSESNGGDPLLEVRSLKKYFPIRQGLLQRETGRVHAVDDVTFGVREGETLGLVGESGCGKSTLGRTIVRLLEPTAGQIVFRGRQIEKLSPGTLRPLRREMQMVFQDPYASLNPRKRVGSIIGDPLKLHGIGDAKELYDRPIMPYTEALLSAVPIPDPDLARARERIVLEGDVPSPINPPSGCRFHPRCRYATQVCKEIEPPLVDYGNGHLAACHHPLNVDAAALQAVTAAPESPRAADDDALPRDTSGESHPAAAGEAPTRTAGPAPGSCA